MTTENQRDNKLFAPLPLIVVTAALVIALAWVYITGPKATQQARDKTPDILQDKNPSAGETIELPLKWNDLGARMMEAGVIDQNQFEAIYNQRGGLTTKEKGLLTGRTDGALSVDQDNAGFILNLLWAAGLSNKNAILENGPMADPRYGDPSKFASTGGWSVARGDAMNHYSVHPFVTLTSEQQQLVERVSKNIYRPCCDNAAYFPDCNHGMAMLGLLELLAAEGASEPTMYKTALQMNRFWFPDQYAIIAQYLENNSQSIDGVDPKEILGRNYSSASGYRMVLQALGPQPQKGGVNCGVGSGIDAPTKQSGSRCGI